MSITLKYQIEHISNFTNKIYSQYYSNKQLDKISFLYKNLNMYLLKIIFLHKNVNFFNKYEEIVHLDRTRKKIIKLLNEYKKNLTDILSKYTSLITVKEYYNHCKHYNEINLVIIRTFRYINETFLRNNPLNFVRYNFDKISNLFEKEIYELIIKCELNNFNDFYIYLDSLHLIQTDTEEKNKLKKTSFEILYIGLLKDLNIVSHLMINGALVTHNKKSFNAIINYTKQMVITQSNQIRIQKKISDMKSMITNIVLSTFFTSK